MTNYGYTIMKLQKLLFFILITFLLLACKQKKKNTIFQYLILLKNMPKVLKFNPTLTIKS